MQEITKIVNSVLRPIVRALASSLPTLFAIVLSPALFAQATHPTMNQVHQRPIDRHALVTRHNVVLTGFDGERPLQVGKRGKGRGLSVGNMQISV